MAPFCLAGQTGQPLGNVPLVPFGLLSRPVPQLSRVCPVVVPLGGSFCPGTERDKLGFSG